MPSTPTQPSWQAASRSPLGHPGSTAASPTLSADVGPGPGITEAVVRASLNFPHAFELQHRTAEACVQEPVGSGVARPLQTPPPPRRLQDEEASHMLHGMLLKGPEDGE